MAEVPARQRGTGAQGRVTTLEWHDDELLTPEQRAAVLGPGAPFEIVDEDVQGARVQVFAQRPRNVRVMLEEAAENFGDRPFFVFPEQTITFAEMPGIVARVAAVLADDYGLRHGDRLAIAAANSRAYALVEWGAVSLGVIVAGLNGWWTAAELAYGVELSDPAVIMGDGPRLARIAEAGIEVGVPIADLDDVLARAEQRDADRAPDRRHRRRRPAAHPLHERHHRPPQGRDALAPQRHPLRARQRGRPGGVGRARGAAVGHRRQRPHRCAARRSSTSPAPRRCS